LDIDKKQNFFVIHSRVNVNPEGKDIAEEPYDASVSLGFCEKVGVRVLGEPVKNFV
jgi:hypothetical protein